jgi:ABC-2 type transport system permease protein
MYFPLRKYWKTAAMSAASYTGDSPLFVVDYLLRVLRVLILLSLWRLVLEGRGEVSGMSLAAVLTYALIAEAFAEQLNIRTGIEDALWEGTLIGKYLQPLPIVGQFAADMFGRWLFSFAVFSVPLLLLSPVLGVNPLPATGANGALFALSLVLAISVGMAIDFIFGALAAAFRQNIWIANQVRLALVTVTSGALVPLALYPPWFAAAIAWLPFASTASAPLRIYTGTGEALPLLLVQAVWAVALWPIAQWLWRSQREKLAFHGG